eukprot:Tbor_TRINITY_DN5697_c2_g1::TRINITY_DN5697_c2_g1_i3::g.8753::m.8753/K08494/NSPN; novel plant SNARE
MSSELELADEEINTTMDKLRSEIYKLDTIINVTDKRKKVQELKDQLRAISSLVSSLRSEINKTTDLTQKQEFDNKRNTYMIELKEMQAVLRDATSAPRKEVNKNKRDTRTFAERQIENLMGEGGEDGSGFTNATQVLEAGKRINEDAIESLARAEVLQNTAEDTGLGTLQALQKQGETLYNVDEELQELHGNLDRASRDVRWFATRLASDKCFLSLFCLLILGVMVLIFWKIFSDRKKAAAETSGTSTVYNTSTVGPNITPLPPAIQEVLWQFV